MGLSTYIGLSGLHANARGLGVVGNNLANMNTSAFKSSDIAFSDLMGAENGLGTQVSAVRTNFGTGNTLTTGNPLDVAIQGKGFLIVSDATGKFYTRAGGMHLDKTGNLVSQGGLNVLGYVRNQITGALDPNLGLQPIVLPRDLENPVKTTEFALELNLDGGSPTATSFSTSFQLFDSVGGSHTATLRLQKSISAGAAPVTSWNFDLTIPNNEIAGVASTDTRQFSLLRGAIANATPNAGTMVFDNAGTLTQAYIGAAPGAAAPLANLTLPPAGVTFPTFAGGATLAAGVTWKLVKADGTPAVSGFANPSDVTFASQNGSAAGFLASLGVQSDGTISVTFTNGSTVDFAKITTALFANQDGLTAKGDGLYAESATSGLGYVGSPTEGGRGALAGGALETSNVDLATELTKIITFQRGYQANAKVITVTDQIIQETMNIKQ